MSSTPGHPATAPNINESFDAVVLPHLDAAYRLARWLMRNEHDAEDAVQEASLRALRYFRTFSGGNARAWFLRIVRNTCCGRQVADFITLTDLAFKAQQLNQTTMKTVPIFTLVLLIYLAMSLCLTIGMRVLEQKATRGIVRARGR